MQTVGSKPRFPPLAAGNSADGNSRPLLRIESLSKRFGGFAAVDQLSLDIYPGEFFALLGPSGCGKTTLLRLIAGFERPNVGRILLDGVDLASVPPYRRPVNMMFQSYALFPHLSVEANVSFGLKQEGLVKREIAGRVAEPLAALDKKLRDATRFELMELQRQLGLTFIIVTHDQSEAMIVADRIGVMDRGRLMQVAAPAEIYERPNSRWVADFVGDVNLFEGRVGDDRSSVEGTAAGRLRLAAPLEAEPRTPVWVAVRPERMRLTHDKPSPGLENCFAGTIVEIGYLGELSIYQIRLADGSRVRAAIANTGRDERPAPVTHEEIWLSFAPEAAIVLTR